MVRALSELSAEPGRPARHAAPAARVRPQLPVLHARRADGRRRRLPRGPARGRGAPARPGGGRAAQHGPLVHPDGRVPGLGRDDHPRPADGHRPGRRLRRCHGRRLPARHVRAHRPDAPDPAAGRIRARRGLARRAVGRHQDRLPVGGARRVDACGPSTCPSATATAPRSPTTPRRSSGARPTTSRGRAVPASTTCSS